MNKIDEFGLASVKKECAVASYDSPYSEVSVEPETVYVERCVPRNLEAAIQAAIDKIIENG